MTRRYPHRATITWFGESIKDEATGIFQSAELIEKPVKCRFEAAGSSQYSNPNGDALLKYGYKVWLPNLDFEIPKQADIVRDGVSMSITRVEPYQNHVVLWL